MSKFRQTKLLVNTSNFLYNVQQIRSLIPKDTNIMPIIKDNAYGTHINYNIKLLKEAHFKILGVAIPDEGIDIRKRNFNGDILILNPITTPEINATAKYNLTPGVGSFNLLHALGKSKYKFNIHIEIETGMQRTGIQINTLNDFCKIAKSYSNINVTGCYTHFAVADEPTKSSFTDKQIENFKQAIQIIQRYFKLDYIHCCNSAGLVNFKDACFNLVRPGLILYGYYPYNELKKQINLKPCLQLVAPITHIKSVPKNTPISYGGTYITKCDSIIATISIGYGDGIKRSLSNKGFVVINNQLAPIVGTICMDSFMVDITSIDNVKYGDYAYIWDNKLITLEDVANKCNTINYEIITTLSNRVVREFIK